MKHQAEIDGRQRWKDCEIRTEQSKLSLQQQKLDLAESGRMADCSVGLERSSLCPKPLEESFDILGQKFNEKEPRSFFFSVRA